MTMQAMREEMLVEARRVVHEAYSGVRRSPDRKYVTPSNSELFILLLLQAVSELSHDEILTLDHDVAG